MIAAWDVEARGGVYPTTVDWEWTVTSSLGAGDFPIGDLDSVTAPAGQTVTKGDSTPAISASQRLKRVHRLVCSEGSLDDIMFPEILLEFRNISDWKMPNMNSRLFGFLAPFLTVICFLAHDDRCVAQEGLHEWEQFTNSLMEVQLLERRDIQEALQLGNHQGNELRELISKCKNEYKSLFYNKTSEKDLEDKWLEFYRSKVVVRRDEILLPFQTERLGQLLIQYKIGLPRTADAGLLNEVIRDDVGVTDDQARSFESIRSRAAENIRRIKDDAKGKLQEDLVSCLNEFSGSLDEEQLVLFRKYFGGILEPKVPAGPTGSRR